MSASGALSVLSESEVSSVVRIQAVQRGKLDRRDVTEQQQAAVKVQAVQRGRVSRRQRGRSADEDIRSLTAGLDATDGPAAAGNRNMGRLKADDVSVIGHFVHEAEMARHTADEVGDDDTGVEAEGAPAASALPKPPRKQDQAPPATPNQPAARKTDVASSMKKTRSALLGGLRNGKLEKAVAKMEAELDDEPQPEEKAESTSVSNHCARW
jgi:hypothetical protein